ncbi:hypothetical protein EWM64_g3246 [Hericium alpestre]|uniref:Uncharacterized protein n=1 Tax=Hericium alpestre TaxID=135208 RepID=A0A4Z0A252_9AGAM|nr:hypothetical protein EWM64_g3246 [Hericium alpestre]
MSSSPSTGVPNPTAPFSFEAKPTTRVAAQAGLQAGIIGAFASAVQNALGTHAHGASGFLTRTGGTIGFFAAMGATYAATEAIVANQREKEDALNGVVGGCAAGFLAGLRARSLPVAVASCAVLGAVVGTFDYGGQTLQGDTTNLSFEERRQRFFKQPPTPAE